MINIYGVGHIKGIKEIKTTSNGRTYIQFQIGNLDKEGSPWMYASSFDKVAEKISTNLQEGMGVIFSGKLNKYKKNDGTYETTLNIDFINRVPQDIKKEVESEYHNIVQEDFEEWKKEEENYEIRF